MNVPRMPVFVTVNDIADIAGVGRSAVANWRKRHPDFPLPNSSERFDLEEVERWLIERGKIAGRAPRGFILWRLADALRSVAKPADVLRFVLAALVYLEACDRARSERGDGHQLNVDPMLAWPAVRESADDDLATRLVGAATAIENANPVLAGLMTPGLELGKRTDAWLVRTFLDTIEEAAKDDMRLALFEEAVTRVQEADRFRGEFSTPSDLTHLMVRLGAATAGTVFDPASGEGGLLLMAVLGDDRDEAKPMKLVGFERNAEVLNVSRARFFLYNVPAALTNIDAFRVPPEHMPSADLVLLDPPLGASDWGDADVYLDARWNYGVPPPKSGDLAWLQLAVQCLAPGGRAVVLTSTGAASRAGREAAIRSGLIDAGCVVAVVRLPPRLRPNTSIPLALWVLRAPDSTPKTVLLIDAGSLGEQGRSLHTLDEADIERVARVVGSYEADPSRAPIDSKIAWRVAISELVDASLDPTRYRPVATVDVDALHSRRQELTASLAADSGDADAAVAAVLSRLSERR
jgi:type I restriction-modification system DNA methylase subunit